MLTEPEDVSSGSDAIMTLTEIARYLKVSEKTVRRIVQSGELPGVKVSSQWRFARGVVDHWLSSRMHLAPKQQLMDVIGTAPDVLPIARLISPRRILLDVVSGSRDAVLAQLAAPLVLSGIATNAEALVDELVAREDVVSTAIGHGLACPHVRNPATLSIPEPYILLGICREGTDFNALDGRKTYVFAMPLATSEAAHLRLMARISLVFRRPSVVKALRVAATKQDVVDILLKADASLADRS